ncbi:MAG: DJ-1/PfpI family protein [Lachnospiraceae bacterium]|nr:DJ-1/PfpI family protein [Lachnospiraceae bacterium]
MGNVLVVLAEGFEEIEAVTVIDTLRRADISVKTMSITGEKEVTGGHGISVKADIFLKDGINIEETDMIVLPGGMGGRDNMAASVELTDLIRKLLEEGKRVAAICAGPTVLGRLGALEGVECLCYPDPGLESELKGRTVPKGNARTITDGNFTTSMGPATAMEFGLELVSVLKGKEAAAGIAAGMLYNNK